MDSAQLGLLDLPATPRPGGADLSALAALGTAAAAILKLAPNFALAAPPVFLVYLYFYLCLVFF